MKRVLILLLGISVASFGGPVGLTCAETSLLVDLAAQFRGQIDVVMQRQPALQAPLVYRGKQYPILQLQPQKRGTRIVAKVSFPDGVGLLNEFLQVGNATRYVAQLSQMQEKGIPTVEFVGDIDLLTRVVPTKHYQFFSLDWPVALDSIPSGLFEKLIRMRAEFAERVNQVGMRFGIFEGQINPKHIILDLDADTFRLIDIDN